MVNSKFLPGSGLEKAYLKWIQARSAFPENLVSSSLSEGRSRLGELILAFLGERGTEEEEQWQVEEG